jgi:DNA-binding SARP family transcriptional activator
MVRAQRASRLVRAGWALLWLTALLVGLPVTLVWFTGWPWPDRADIRRWITEPLALDVVIHVAVWLLWLLWGWLVYAVIGEVLRWLTRRRLPRLRLPRLPLALHSTVGGLVGVLVLAVTGGSSASHAGNAATAVAAPVQPDLDAHVPAGTGDSIGEAPATGQIEADRGESGDVADRSARPVGGGVDLPEGGWVSDRLAELAAATAATVWWQRRRRYLPGQPVPGGRRDDPDLLELPVTVAAIQQAIDQRPAPAPQVRVEEPLWPWLLPAGGVGLTGPGATEAIRGLLVAALLAAGQHPNAGGVVTTADDLYELFGASVERYRNLPGLRVVDEIAEYLTQRRTVAPTSAAGPTLVLLSRVPGRRQRRRLADLISPPQPDDAVAGVTLAVIGAWSSDTTWHVDADGTTFLTIAGRITVGPRLSVLSAASATDLLILLATLGAQGRPPVWTSQPAVDTFPGAATPDTAPATTTNPSGTDSHRVTARPAELPPLRLRLLGAVRLFTADGQDVHLARSAATQILAYLAVHPHGGSSTEIARAVWPGVPAPTSRLHTTLSALRLSLEHDAGRPVLRRDADRYRLDPTTIEIDLRRLHAAADRADRARSLGERDDALRQIVALYTGELAAGQTWPWLAVPREATRRHVVDALAALADAAPDAPTAIGWLHQAAGHDPDNEHLHRQLIRAQAAAGDPVGAAYTYRRLVERFAAHGDHPSHTTTELAYQLLGERCAEITTPHP